MGSRQNMGRVRNKTVKRASKKIIERYYQRLTLDFNTNKRICDEVAAIPSKRLRNKIAGFTTHMMKRISRGPIKGISLKLQEEEREKRLDYIPGYLCCRPRDREGHQEHAPCYGHGWPSWPQCCVAQGAQAVWRPSPPWRPSPTQLSAFDARTTAL